MHPYRYTGEKAPIRGKGNFRLRIGSTEIVLPTWIADIQDERILGLEISLQKPAVVTTLTSCRAVLETTVILPPQSECVVPAKMDGQWKHKPRWGIMEAGTRNKEAESALEGLLVARTLVDLHQPTTVMRMMNLTGQKRKVKKGTEIARFEQVASVVLQQKEIESEMLHLPEHLKELYMRNSHGLTKDQCQQTMYFLDAVASKEATSSNVFPSSFSFSPFQFMMRHLFQIPVLHTKEGILTVGSICWNVSLHYWFYLSRTFNTIIFTVLLKFL